VNLRFALGPVAKAFAARLDALDRMRFAERLWGHDASLWGGDPARARAAASRLGWLDSPAQMVPRTGVLEEFAVEAGRRGFTHAVLLGMGGSSLAPETLRLTFGVAPGFLDLAVLDNTSPAAVRSVTAAHDPRRTLFLVSSKSGGTLEVSCFERHFFEWTRAVLGDAAGHSFAAITDPGTPLERLAAERGYLRVFTNAPDIGGRYSALSYFGLVPAAITGVDLEALLDGALEEARASGARVPAAANPGVALGAALGELALAGRDKVTLVLDPRLAALGGWIEQLLAESTGKDGRGLVPVADEPLAEPAAYGADRVFVAVGVQAWEPATAAALDALEHAGHPVVRWTRAGVDELGAEFLRWEIATAVAGAVLEVNPFDEPNVTEAKDATRAALERFLATGRFPARSAPDPAALAEQLARLRPGDYFAILAYLHRTPERHARLARLRLAVRDRARVATTLGYGPRFLHSTGQLHKGGPDTGVFLQLTADEGEDLPIPGERYGFEALRRAQAEGDLEVLERRGRRVLHLHLGHEVERGLETLAGVLSSATPA